VLKAVHAAPSATPGLLPALTDRDILSMLHADLSSKLSAAQMRATAAEREIVGVNAQNQNLARAMVVLAEQLKEESTEAIEDAAMRARLEELDKQLGAARREWRTVKSLVAGVVVGSGVDWAADPKLLELVIDDEDEIG
jgi:Centromere protein H (CENP-H)